MTEYRAAAAVQLDGTVKGRINITPMRYDVTDDYKTRFAPGCFTEFLESGHGPVFCWGHDWRDPIGQMVDYADSKKELRVNMQLDDMDAVPRARQAYAQLGPNPATGKSTLTQVSVGFDRKAVEDGEAGDDWDLRFLKADLPETSVVISGAVPGAVVNSVRSSIADGLGIPESLLREYERKVATGEMEWEAAAAEMRLRAAAENRATHVHAKQDGSGKVTHSHSGDSTMHAHTGLMPMTQLIVPGKKGRGDAPAPEREEAAATEERAQRHATAEAAADALLQRHAREVA